MPRLPNPSPVIALGVTQIVGYGTLYYAFGVLAGALAGGVGVGLPFAFGAFSAALLVGGAVAPIAGRAIARYGARAVMAGVAFGLALVALAALARVPR